MLQVASAGGAAPSTGTPFKLPKPLAGGFAKYDKSTGCLATTSTALALPVTGGGVQVSVTSDRAQADSARGSLHGPGSRAIAAHDGDDQSSSFVRVAASFGAIAFSASATVTASSFAFTAKPPSDSPHATDVPQALAHCSHLQCSAAIESFCGGHGGESPRMRRSALGLGAAASGAGDESEEAVAEDVAAKVQVDEDKKGGTGTGKRWSARGHLDSDCAVPVSSRAESESFSRAPPLFTNKRPSMAAQAAPSASTAFAVSAAIESSRAALLRTVTGSLEVHPQPAATRSVLLPVPLAVRRSGRRAPALSSLTTVVEARKVRALLAALDPGHSLLPAGAS